jgi:hypothetical protein
MTLHQQFQLARRISKLVVAHENTIRYVLAKQKPVPNWLAVEQEYQAWLVAEIVRILREDAQ